MTVFNEKSTGHITGKYPLFLGEERGLYDNVHMNHPRLFKLYEELKAIDWLHDEVPLTQTRMDLMKVDKVTRDIMLYNLAYQWRADSAIGNSLATLLQPFITNSEYAHVVSRIAENENLHSLTYSNIARQCLPNPRDIFDLVYKTDEILGRAGAAINALEDLDKVGCKYKLGMMTKDECRPFIFKGVVAIFMLERISFMNSFSATFSLAREQLFVGAAKLVQKVCQDELIHFEVARYAVKDILADPLFSKSVKECMPEVMVMLSDMRSQERTWNKFLFSEGRYVIGLTEEKLNLWSDYNIQDVYRTVGLKPDFPLVEKDPLPWFATDWVDLNSHQNANMETPNTNYALNTVVDDGTELEIDDDFENF